MNLVPASVNPINQSGHQNSAFIEKLTRTNGSVEM